MADSKKLSKLRKMLQGGCLLECYTLNNWFVKVQPVFRIDKVKIAFVEKGKKGSGFDIYVDTMKFNRLCKDIQSRVLERKIEADTTSDYPTAWVYKTGENGSLEVAIGKGRKGILFQGRVISKEESKRKTAIVPVASYEDLAIMADLWFMFSKEYMEELNTFFSEALIEISKYHNANEEVGEEYQETAAESNEPAPASEPTPAYQKLTILTTSLLQPFGSKNSLCFKAQDEEMNDCVFVIESSAISTFDKAKWEDFKAKAEANTNLTYTVFADTQTFTDRFIFKGIA